MMTNPIFFPRYSIERDAQLLANRIALLKQEEMKTWKKIEETKKRTGDITTLKKRNEDKVQKVSWFISQLNAMLVDNCRIWLIFFAPLQKIFDIKMDNEHKRMQSQNNYVLSRQRYNDKKKVQDALLL